MKANRSKEIGREFGGKLIIKEDVSVDSDRFVRSRFVYIESKQSFVKRIKTAFVITAAMLSGLLSFVFYYY